MRFATAWFVTLTKQFIHKSPGLMVEEIATMHAQVNPRTTW